MNTKFPKFNTPSGFFFSGNNHNNPNPSLTRIAYDRPSKADPSNKRQPCIAHKKPKLDLCIYYIHCTKDKKYFLKNLLCPSNLNNILMLHCYNAVLNACTYERLKLVFKSTAI